MPVNWRSKEKYVRLEILLLRSWFSLPEESGKTPVLLAATSDGISAAHSVGDVLGDVEFEAVLVGKDGGVKDRYREIVDPSAIFPFIDAMPMRMDEMRE